MYFTSKILWSQVSSGKLRNLQFLTDKTWEILPLVPHPILLPPFLSFNLLVKLMVAIVRCVKECTDVCVYIVCMLTLPKDTF